MPQQPIYRTLDHASNNLDAPVVAIGNFDGAHIGHQSIFRLAREVARKNNTDYVALTFEPHPVRFFKPDTEAFRLTPSQQRAELLLDYGLDAVVELDFDRDMASLEPEEFIDQILVDGLGACAVVVGQDFAFGRGRSGSTDDLQRLGRERGLDTHICRHVERDELSISSTRIRTSIGQGDMEEAASFLGRPYRIRGDVVQGDQRGRALGFPTANIETPNKVLPPNGVYATTLHVPDMPALPSITNIGTRPTFGGDDITVECFVLHHDEELDLYGERVQLDLWTFVRPEKQFDAPDGLIRQIQKDVAWVQRYFGLD